MRSSVSMVIRLPSRKRCTSLPSLTARRPKVDSAMSAWRQKSVIWLRISSFLMPWEDVGQRLIVPLSYHHLPNRGMDLTHHRNDADEASTVVELITAWRGVSGGEVTARLRRHPGMVRKHQTRDLEIPGLVLRTIPE